jgi:MerR family transcriptional regulator, copper efflux regulator
MQGKLIGEIAKELGLRPGTVRYYEVLHLLPTPRRSAGGYRLYDGESRQRLVFIANAKSLGLTLREIRQIITVRNSGRFPCDSVRTMLLDHVRSIDQQIARLQVLKSDLQAILSASRTRPGSREAVRDTVCPMIETVPGGRRRLTSGGEVR